MRGSLINYRKMKGMCFDVEYNGTIYINITIKDYIESNKRYKYKFEVEYNSNVCAIWCGDFLMGKFGSVLRGDLNNKYIDQDNVVHIHIKNTKGEEFEALYSGQHIEEVMKCNWYLSGGGYATSRNYNNKRTKLHHVDFSINKNTEIIKHLNNNPLDNRIENLVVSDFTENTRNKKTNNKFGLTGIMKNNNNIYTSRFTVNGYRITTKRRSDLEEAKLDNLISQRYLGYNHNEEMFYLLDNVSEERIEEVTDLLDKYIKNNEGKILKPQEYNHNIEKKDGYYILHKSGKEMLFDCDLEFIKNKRMWENRDYWTCEYICENELITNRFHRELMGLTPNNYSSYNIHIDHINHNHSDNRYSNLIITTDYGNQCNKKGKGYSIEKSKYRINCMSDYRFWDLIGGVKRPSFTKEQEAIDEVERRRNIVEKSRVKLHNKEELDELIEYCLDNGYILENGLADLDLGYLYYNKYIKLKRVV